MAILNTSIRTIAHSLVRIGRGTTSDSEAKSLVDNATAVIEQAAEVPDNVKTRCQRAVTRYDNLRGYFNETAIAGSDRMSLCKTALQP